jgi:hypothetical protein
MAHETRAALGEGGPGGGEFLGRNVPINSQFHCRGQRTARSVPLDGVDQLACENPLVDALVRAAIGNARAGLECVSLRMLDLAGRRAREALALQSEQRNGRRCAL